MTQLASQSVLAFASAAQAANTQHHHHQSIALLVFIFGIVAIALIFLVARIAQTRSRKRNSAQQPPSEPAPRPDQSE